MNVLLLMLEDDHGTEVPVIALAKEPWGKSGQEVKTVTATIKLEDDPGPYRFENLFYGELELDGKGGNNGKKGKDKNAAYKNSR